jgi:hypothetical protein
MSQIRKNYYGQKADANSYETLTFLSWERHGRNDDRSKGTVNMGFSSGRGMHAAVSSAAMTVAATAASSAAAGATATKGLTATTAAVITASRTVTASQASTGSPASTVTLASTRTRASTAVPGGMTAQARTVSRGAMRRPLGAR